jgi:hypothetical protein
MADQPGRLSPALSPRQPALHYQSISILSSLISIRRSTSLIEGDRKVHAVHIYHPGVDHRGLQSRPVEVLFTLIVVLRTVLHVPSEFFLKSSHVSMTVGFGAHAAAKIATAAVASARIVRISFRQSKIRKLATVIAATATLVWAHEHAADAKGDSK